MTSDPDLRAAVEALPEELDQWADTFEEERAQGARSTAAFAHALVRAILAEHPATSGEVGRCGDRAQPLQPAGTTAVCRLPHGHPGWHKGDDGSEWTHATPAEPDAGGEGLTEAEVERACEVMHDAYEAAAVAEGWETQERSRKPWSEVPEANKATMRAAVSALLASDLVADRERVLRDRIAEVEGELAPWREMRRALTRDAFEANHRADAAEALAAERGERLAAVQALAAEWQAEWDAGQARDEPVTRVIRRADAAERVRAALGSEAADLLADRERRAEARGAERAWDEAVQECHDLGWLHDWAKSDALARNPYRADRIAGEGQ